MLRIYNDYKVYANTRIGIMYGTRDCSLSVKQLVYIHTSVTIRKHIFHNGSMVTHPSLQKHHHKSKLLVVIIFRNDNFRTAGIAQNWPTAITLFLFNLVACRSCLWIPEEPLAIAILLRALFLTIGTLLAVCTIWIVLTQLSTCQVANSRS